MCNEWLLDVTKFINWSNYNNYESNLELDRIDNNGNYEPNNCRWVTRQQNMNNTSRNKLITYQNITKTCAEWDRLYDLPSGRVNQRLKLGWSIENAITKPCKRKRKKNICCV